MPPRKSTQPTSFTVTGRGAFPLDQLRYCACWPATSLDSVYIYDSIVSPNAPEPRSIRLTQAAGYPLPDMARWRAMGWEVSDGR